MKIRFLCPAKLFLEGIALAIAEKKAEVGCKKIFSYCRLLFLNKTSDYSHRFLLPAPLIL